jgi:hypothetical protein
MATDELEPMLAPHVTGMLDDLRRRIRSYVWRRGLALVLCAAAAAFWLALLIDWTFEPSRDLRLAMLVIAGLGICYVVYRMIVSRAFVPLSDRSMAVVLEREYGHFGESLLTAVELSNQHHEFAPHAQEMLAHTCREAAYASEQVDLNRVFNRVPLVSALAAAALAALSVATFAWGAPDAFHLGVARLATLSDAPWPRNTRLVMEGFAQGEAVVAKGGDLKVVVKADTEKQVPEFVEIRYRTVDGVRERKNMVREGNSVAGRDPFQPFEYTFQSVLTPIVFDVRGGDARIRNLRVRVVDSPSLVTTVHCEYPAYMRREPRDMPVTAAMPLPRGSRITLRATANKDLVKARIDYQAGAGAPRIWETALDGEGSAARIFQFTLARLDADTTLSFTLLDRDGIQNRDPLRVSLLAVPDSAPQVNVHLSGIGSAITPSARLPMIGEVTDDYGLSRVWTEHAVDTAPPEQTPLGPAPDGRVELKVDGSFEVRDLKLKPGQKLVVGAKASDNHKLPDQPEPNIGQGERYLVDVVTPEALRTMLESRELNLRQRFETIIGELTETRDSMTRLETIPAAAGIVAAPKNPPKPDAEPDDDPDSDSNDKSPQRQLERARLRVARATQNSEKNSQETLGLASSFEGIRDELVNNRIDTEELKNRLQGQIATPLHTVAETMFPELERRLAALDVALSGQVATAAAAQREALAQTDAILVEMHKIRDKMLELETFNEALDLLRSIIDAQKNLDVETKKQRSDKVRKLLED